MSGWVKNWHKLLCDPAKEGEYATEVDKKGEEQKGYEE